jgi:peptidoglycan/LPS O-acetylase OafA/YrhL
VLQGRDISEQRFQQDALDGLRGMAVLIVLCSHVSNSGMYLLPGLNLSGIGKTGVFLFFVLSAFLLTYPLVAKDRRGELREFLGNYALRRFFRIYPLYVLYLLLALATTWWFNGSSPGEAVEGIPFSLTPRELVQHLLLQQDKGVTWSILVEFRYYFLLPLVALLFSAVLHNRLLPCAAVTAVMIALVEWRWPEAKSLPSDHRLMPYLPIFLMGSLTAVIHLQWRERGLHGRRNLALALDLAGLAAAIAWIATIPSVASTLLGRPVPEIYFHRHFLLFGLLWSLILFASMNGYGLIRWFFEARWLRYLGFISFSVYLLHIIAVRYIHQLVDVPYLDAWVLLAVTVAVSTLSWRWIERPSSRIKFSRINPSGASALTS